MTHEDAKEAIRLLLIAGIPRKQVNYQAVILADAIIKDMNRRLA
jgi:hypothetical protein